MIIKRNGKTGVYFTDYRDLIVELNRIDPTFAKRMKSQYKVVAKPAQSDVKKSIPLTPPTSGIHRKTPQASVSGFYPVVVPGRLTWGANAQNNNKNVRSVLIETPSMAKIRKGFKRSGGKATSIARLRVDNAAVVMADMAGKSNRYTDRAKQTREYQYSRSASGSRRHRINGQGKAMIRALGGRASRFVWPAAEKSVPKVQSAVNGVLQEAINTVNRRMR